MQRFRSSSTGFLFWTAACAITLGLASGGPVRAQADSSFSKISTTSDVQLQIEAVKGTNHFRLQAFADAVGPKMPDVRTCYDRIVQENPTVSGTLALNIIAAAKSARVRVVPTSDTVKNRKLAACVMRELRRAKVKAYRATSGAKLTLRFNNTAEKGAKLVQDRRNRSVYSGITRGSDGTFIARGATADEDVSYTVQGADKEGVGTVRDALQKRAGTLLDCRRRAENGGKAEGSMTASLSLNLHRAAKVEVKESSIENRRAMTCLTGLLKRTRYQGHTGVRAYTVKVAFAAATPLPDDGPKGLKR